MIAIVTGATSGIGEATAIKLASMGYNLVITGRRKERLNKLQQELENAHSIKCVCLEFDIRDNNQVEQALNSLQGEWRNIDLLVNNAGLAAGLSQIQDGLLSDWERMIDTNVKGLLYISKVVSNWMINNKRGHIVNIGSTAAKEVYPKGNVYCASKHAVDAISKAMRMDLLEHGIKVTQINPGLVETEFSIVRLGDKQKADAVYAGMTPLVAKDIADTIEFVITRPNHVCINDIVLTPTDQASSTIVKRSN